MVNDKLYRVPGGHGVGGLRPRVCLGRCSGQSLGQEDRPRRQVQGRVLVRPWAIGDMGRHGPTWRTWPT